MSFRLRVSELFSSEYRVLWIAGFLYVAGALMLSWTPFFWDSVSVLSRPATVLYENGFSSLYFPESTVSDNLPLSILLALWWMVFGRTLFSTHVLFILFGLAFVWQLFGLCREVMGKSRGRDFVFLLLLCDTTLLTQLLVPMFDIVMVLCALVCLRGILSGNKAKVVAGAFFLAMLRSRGVMVCAALGLFALLHAVCRKGMNWRLAASLIGREMLLFLPALAVSVFLFAVQMRNQEVVFGMGKDSLWRIADMGRIMGNLVSFPLFLLDLGKVFLWVVLLFVVLKYGWAKVWTSLPCPLVGAYAVLLVVFFLMTVPFKNPYGGRYFMLLYILMSLLLGKLMFDLMPLRRARLLCVGLMLLLGTAHLGWYSTLRVTQWDCSLLHLPYYRLRWQALDYLGDRHVLPHQVSSFFPADKPSDLIDLDKAKSGVWACEPFAGEAAEADYILYSNISNVLDRSKAGIDSSCALQKRFEKGAVFIEVWKRH